MKKFLLICFLGLTALTMAAVNVNNTAVARRQAAMADKSQLREMPKGAPVNFLEKASKGKVSPFAGRNAKPLSFEDGANIYGFLYFMYGDYNPDWEPGAYELTDDYMEELWIDPVLISQGLQVNDGWYVDGKLCGVNSVLSDGYFYTYFKYTIDLLTGELEDYEEYYDQVYDYDVFFFNSKLNLDDNKVYGYAYELGFEWNVYWTVADFDNILEAQTIKLANDEFCYSMCYNPSDGYFYGVNIKQQFVKIGLDGKQTFIAEMPDAEYLTTYQTGLVWSPVTELFYWNSIDSSGYGSLWSITADGTADFLALYYDGEQFAYMFTTDEYVNADQPSKPTVKEVLAGADGLSANVSYEMPTTFGDGTPLPPSFGYTAVLDDRIYTTGTAGPGADVDIKYTVEEQGMHSLGLFVTVNGKNSVTASVSLYLGDDEPKAPEKVTLTATEISWTPVTEGVRGGYIDLENLTYNVYLNGEPVGTTNQTSVAAKIPDTGDLKAYVASVVAVNGKLEGKPAYSNKMVGGAPLTVPVSIEPTESEFELMVSVDANNDGVEWDYNTTYSAAQISYSTSPDVPMDDYLFLPPVKIDDTTFTYEFSLEAARYNNYLDESMEVVFATSPDASAVSGTIIEPFNPEAKYTAGEWSVMTGEWDVPAAGVYYIGIHCVSPGDLAGLFARNFSLVKTNNPSGIESAEIQSVSVTVDCGEIVVSGCAGSEVSVYAVDGRKVAGGVSACDVQRYNVEKGVYIVKAGSTTAKVYVK